LSGLLVNIQHGVSNQWSRTVAATYRNWSSFGNYFADPNYGSYQALTYQNLPPAGEFHHLAVTFRQPSAEQLQLTAFIDGQSVQTASFPGNFSRTLSTAPVTIGCSNPNGEFFNGNIDEVSIYNRAL